MNINKNEVQGTPYPPHVNNDEVDLLSFYKIIKAQKHIILFFVILGAITGVITAFSLPQYYTVSMTVIPNEQQNSNSSGSGSGSLMLLAGLSGSKKIDEKEIGLIILESRNFILNFINKHDLLPILYPEIDVKKEAPPPPRRNSRGVLKTFCYN